jgi:hypothetical protein
MRDLDKMIDEAIDEEERDLLRRIGEEPDFIDQAFGIFGGKAGWVNVVLMVVMTLLFIAGVWTAWMFFAADDPVTQLRWGLPAAVLLLTSLMIKMAVWPTVQVNQVLRELKLIEFQLARSAGRLDRPAQTIE